MYAGFHGSRKKLFMPLSQPKAVYKEFNLHRCGVIPVLQAEQYTYGDAKQFAQRIQ